MSQLNGAGLVQAREFLFICAEKFPQDRVRVTSKRRRRKSCRGRRFAHTNRIARELHRNAVRSRSGFYCTTRDHVGIGENLI